MNQRRTILSFLLVDSTHGTFVNKNRVKPRTYVRVRVGYQLKLGNSTRNYILQGPSEDEDEASEFSITELKEQKAQREADLRQKLAEEKLERERMEKEKEEAGVSWGMSEDAEDEPDLSENPFAVTTNQELFLDDPKKTLRGFFEREGYDLEYKCDELSPGVFICRVELPVGDEYGKNIICEIQHKGKKKECVVQCALEACRILDRHGVLRQANHEPRRSKRVNSDDDSDDDNFFDRTGDVEKKRLKKLGPAPSEALSYEQLMEQEKEMLDKIQTKEHKLQLMVQLEKRQKMQTDEDLDQFMNNLSSMDHKVDKFTISTTKMEIQTMKSDHQNIQKLINIAKPSITLPSIAQSKTKLPLFGKRNSLGRNFGVKKTDSPAETKKSDAFSVEEDEDEPEKSTEPAKVELKEEKKVLGPTLDLKLLQSAQEDETESALKPDPKPTQNSEEKLPAKHEAKLQPVEKKIKIEKPSKSVSTQDSAPASSEQAVTKTATQEPTKKRKSRVRVRNRLRENIDMNDDDEYIDEEKVSTWVAPDDQTGDGTTHLNNKYGY